MNLYKLIILWIYSVILLFNGYMNAQNTSTKWTNNPIYIVDQFGQDVNEDTRIQDTALNDINPNQGQYPSEYRIANAFDSIRIQIAPYLQRIMYIGLSLAVIGIIYNGFLMVTKPVWSDWDTWKVKERLIKIVTWVFLLTWFYVIIQVILAIIDYIITS